MGRGINKWIGVGNCCADPETRYAPSGSAVTNLTMACGDEYTDKNTGQKQDKTEFVRLVFFNKLGEIAGEYLKKGSQIYVEGKIQTKKWQDQNGVDKYSTEIVVRELVMLGGRGSSGQEGQQGAPQGQQQQSAPQQSNNDGWDDMDDKIPF